MFAAATSNMTGELCPAAMVTSPETANKAPGPDVGAIPAYSVKLL